MLSHGYSSIGLNEYFIILLYITNVGELCVFIQIIIIADIFNTIINTNTLD